MFWRAGMNNTKFKSGDKVVFCKSSLESGMIDAKEGDVFTIKESYGPGSRVVSLKELSGYYHKTHFEHYVEKEKVMEKYIPEVGDKAKGFKFDSGTDGVGYDTEMDDYVEEVGVVVDAYTDSFVVQFPDSLEWMYPASLSHLAKIEESPREVSHEDSHIDWQGSQINWQVGQVVWDCAYGKGIVESVSLIDDEIHVQFERFNTSFNYDVNGIIYGGGSRTLFFSEPKIIAETKPPKKSFVPTLKKGTDVLIKSKYAAEPTVWVVDLETEDRIYISNGGRYYMKQDIEYVRILGEQVKFS